ncbi:LytR/AlgR family response regulator transcription factor [Chondrinema litorale]|uniref:LytR/AlgR family response regulator transcription factor n=1 Tax=Chondrinema litorale TaxID=2994555 RepID=UPI00254300F6|nr:LytTR family DNA-binding domain-containing protein [Chondrinema litorale]UZR97083.1 LytTR family DNA-binding domain-containing protein [Chondrinema litorale]
MINCVIIDDEPLAREGIARYVNDIDYLNLIDTFENPVALSSLSDSTKVDLIFLDIHMPKMNGIDFLKINSKPPMVIITTAFPGYALEGFQLNVMDYLLKPITFDRFYKATNKARDYHQLKNKPEKQLETRENYFFIKCENKYEKIYFDDILYIQGMQNYVMIYTNKGKYLTLLSMKSLEENLDSTKYIRTHKSYIVSIEKITAIEGNQAIIQQENLKNHHQNIRIPISRNYRDLVLEKVVNERLWRK